MNYIERVAQALLEEIPPAALPDGDTESMFILYAVLCLTKGTEATGEDVHDAWSAWMTLREERHESLVPYGNLPADVRAEDSPYVAAIHKVASRLNTLRMDST